MTEEATAPGPESESDEEPEAARLVMAAREASAYAEGAARASWDSLIRAAKKTEEAVDAWRETRDLEASAALDDTAPGGDVDSDDPVVAAELAILAALPREARRNLARLADDAASRAREAREIAQFTSSMTSQAATAWGEAEDAWLRVRDELNVKSDDHE